MKLYKVVKHCIVCKARFEPKSEAASYCDKCVTPTERFRRKNGR